MGIPRTYLVRKKEGQQPRCPHRDKLPFPVHSKSIFTLDGVVLAFDPSFYSVQPCELLRLGLEGGFSREMIVSGAVNETLPLVVQEDSVTVAGGVDLSHYVVNGSIRLCQKVDRPVEAGVVHTLALSLDIVLESDAFGREVFDRSGRVLPLQL